MRDRLIKRGLSPRIIRIVENWADGRAIEPLPIRRTGQLRILYSGNLGEAHDIDTIFEAMRSLKHDPRFHFTFAGGGARRQELAAMCGREQFPEVTFADYCSRDKLSASLGSGDIGLVTQKESCTGSVVPSKTYGIMAAGRPILFIGPADATPAHIIRTFRCGWQVNVGNTAELVELLLFLESDPELVRDAGQRARQAFLRHYDISVGANRIAAVIEHGDVIAPSAPLEVFPYEVETVESASASSGGH